MLRPMPIHPLCITHHLLWIRGVQGAGAYPSIHCVKGSICNFVFIYLLNLMREPGEKPQMQTPQEKLNLESNPKTSCCV